MTEPGPMPSWIDITVPLHSGLPVWPGDPAPEIGRVASMEAGDVCNLTRLSMGAHTGTHMDAPRHFLRDGETMEGIPLDAVMGPVRVLGIDAVRIEAEHLELHDLQRGERILLKTPNSRRAWWNEAFDSDFAHLSLGAARHLAERGVRTVGVDYLSVGGFEKDGVEVHQAILGAGIWVIEGLDLTAVEPGWYEMACLPLKLVGADGAPARAVLRRV